MASSCGENCSQTHEFQCIEKIDFTGLSQIDGHLLFIAQDIDVFPLDCKLAVEDWRLNDAVISFSRCLESAEENKANQNKICYLKNNLGCVHGMLGNSEKAHELLESAMKLGEIWLTKNDCVIMKNNLARNFMNSEKYLDAMVIFSALFDKLSDIEVIGDVINLKSHDEDERSRTHSNDKEVETFGISSRFSKLFFSNKSIVKGQSYRKEYTTIAVIMLNYARVNSKLQNYHKAIEILHSLRAHVKLKFDIDSSLTISIISLLITSLTQTGCMTEAKKFHLMLQPEISMINRRLDDQRFKPVLFAQIEGIVWALVCLGKRPQARNLLERTLDVCKDVYGEDHLLTQGLIKTVSEQFPSMNYNLHNGIAWKGLQKLPLHDIIALFSTCRVGFPNVSDFHFQKERSLEFLEGSESTIATTCKPDLCNASLKNAFCTSIGMITSCDEKIAEDAIEITVSRHPLKEFALNSSGSIYYIVCLCILMEACIVIKATSSINLVCNAIIDLLTYIKNADKNKTESTIEIYKDCYGMVSFYLSYREVSIGAKPTKMCTMITCGRRPKDDVMDEEREKPLFRTTALENYSVIKGFPGTGKTTSALSFLRSFSLMDLTELRKIDESVVKNMSSICPLSAMILVEVVLINLSLPIFIPRINLLGGCFYSEAKLGIPTGPVKEFYYHEYKRCLKFASKTAPTLLAAALQHQLMRQVLAGEVRKSSEGYELHLSDGGWLTLATQEETLLLNLKVLRNYYVTSDVMLCDIKYMCDDVIEKCLAYFDAIPLNVEEEWERVESGNAECVEVVETVEDKLAHALERNVELMRETEYLQNKVLDLTDECQELKENVAVLQTRLTPSKAENPEHLTNRREYSTVEEESAARDGASDSLLCSGAYEQTGSLSLDIPIGDQENLREIGEMEFEREKAKRDVQKYIFVPQEIASFKRRNAPRQRQQLEDSASSTSVNINSSLSDYNSRSDDKSPTPVPRKQLLDFSSSRKIVARNDDKAPTPIPRKQHLDFNSSREIKESTTRSTSTNTVQSSMYQQLHESYLYGEDVQPLKPVGLRDQNHVEEVFCDGPQSCSAFVAAANDDESDLCGAKSGKSHHYGGGYSLGTDPTDFDCRGNRRNCHNSGSDIGSYHDGGDGNRNYVTKKDDVDHGSNDVTRKKDVGDADRDVTWKRDRDYGRKDVSRKKGDDSSYHIPSKSVIDYDESESDNDFYYGGGGGCGGDSGGGDVGDGKNDHVNGGTDIHNENCKGGTLLTQGLPLENMNSSNWNFPKVTTTRRSDEADMGKRKNVLSPTEISNEKIFTDGLPWGSEFKGDERRPSESEPYEFDNTYAEIYSENAFSKSINEPSNNSEMDIHKYPPQVMNITNLRREMLDESEEGISLGEVDMMKRKFIHEAAAEVILAGVESAKAAAQKKIREPTKVNKNKLLKNDAKGEFFKPTTDTVQVDVPGMNLPPTSQIEDPSKKEEIISVLPKSSEQRGKEPEGSTTLGTLENMSDNLRSLSTDRQRTDFLHKKGIKDDDKNLYTSKQCQELYDDIDGARIHPTISSSDDDDFSGRFTATHATHGGSSHPNGKLECFSLPVFQRTDQRNHPGILMGRVKFLGISQDNQKQKSSTDARHTDNENFECEKEAFSNTNLKDSSSHLTEEANQYDASGALGLNPSFVSKHSINSSRYNLGNSVRLKYSSLPCAPTGITSHCVYLSADSNPFIPDATVRNAQSLTQRGMLNESDTMSKTSSRRTRTEDGHMSNITHGTPPIDYSVISNCYEQFPVKSERDERTAFDLRSCEDLAVHSGNAEHFIFTSMSEEPPTFYRHSQISSSDSSVATAEYASCTSEPEDEDESIRISSSSSSTGLITAVAIVSSDTSSKMLNLPDMTTVDVSTEPLPSESLFLKELKKASAVGKTSAFPLSNEINTPIEKSGDSMSVPFLSDQKPLSLTETKTTPTVCKKPPISLPHEMNTTTNSTIPSPKQNPLSSMATNSTIDIKSPALALVSYTKDMTNSSELTSDSSLNYHIPGGTKSETLMETDSGDVKSLTPILENKICDFETLNECANAAGSVSVSTTIKAVSSNSTTMNVRESDKLSSEDRTLSNTSKIASMVQSEVVSSDSSTNQLQVEVTLSDSATSEGKESHSLSSKVRTNTATVAQGEVVLWDKATNKLLPPSSKSSPLSRRIPARLSGDPSREIQFAIIPSKEGTNAQSEGVKFPVPPSKSEASSGQVEEYVAATDIPSKSEKSCSSTNESKGSTCLLTNAPESLSTKGELGTSNTTSSIGTEIRSTSNYSMPSSSSAYETSSSLSSKGGIFSIQTCTPSDESVTSSSAGETSSGLSSEAKTLSRQEDKSEMRSNQTSDSIAYAQSEVVQASSNGELFSTNEGMVCVSLPHNTELSSSGSDTSKALTSLRIKPSGNSWLKHKATRNVHTSDESMASFTTSYEGATSSNYSASNTLIDDASNDNDIKSLEQTVSRYTETFSSLVVESFHEMDHQLRQALKLGRERRLKKEMEEIEKMMERRKQREREVNDDKPRPASLPVQESDDAKVSCTHFKRGCDIKFPCCQKYYQCHRCHNSSKLCEVTDSKASDATHLRCRTCMTEQEITPDRSSCIHCKRKLSEYFCGICKHYTADDKKPYHCNPCGICRVHRDNSFHCEVCNVCLNKKLQGKHKCRPNSGHDECCICLEDAFGGCQVLPCSHKVHRDCAVLMVKNGVRKCPICRAPIYQE